MARPSKTQELGKVDLSNNGGWAEYKRLVLYEMERINERLGEIDNKLSHLDRAVVKLQVKSGLWGAMAGAVPAAIAILYMLVSQ